jgi:Mrp family chromosome partitioning ATPase
MSTVFTDRPCIPQRSREMADLIALLAYARLPLAALAAGLAVSAAATLAWPAHYSATARIMLPAGAREGSRIVKLEQAAGDPRAAAAEVSDKLQTYLRQKAVLIDPPSVMRQRPSLGLNLVLGGAGGLAVGLAWLAARQRARRPVRSERELLQALGEPLLALRPLRPEVLRELCARLLEHWFTPQRRLLAIVSAQPGEGRTRLAGQLSAAFAAMGEKTLLIDGDLRAPALHRAFNLPNAHGLADLLEDRSASLASSGTHLSVMVAGRPRTDPLELLSRSRLPAFLAEAAKHFRVVLIDTPAAARGPDFQIFAALAGGALVVTAQKSANVHSLRGLHAALERCSARLVATVARAD